jgi:hypothetical protein
MEANAFVHDSPATAEAGRWMTHDELAAIRGIDRPSAVRLALRHGWRKQRDKNRVARVLVPLEWANQNQGRGADAAIRSASGPGTSDYADQVRRATEARARQSDQTRAVERSMWQERVASESGRADKAEQEHARLLGIIDALETRIVSIEARADTADEDRRAAEARADAAVSRALVAEGDRRVAEARADAERARADVLHEAVATERAHAATLKAKVDELKGLLATVVRAQRSRRR